MAEGRRRRVAVVGGGVAGLVTAWLLDSAHDVVLVERNPWLGGHAHSVPVRDGGVVDLGAQFVTPSVQPTYWRLAQHLGMRFARVRGTAALNDPRRLVDSVRPWRAPVGSSALGALVLAGREFRGRDREGAGSWDVTVDEFVARRLGWLPRSAREDVLLPWIASLNNCDIEAVRRTCARAALAFLVRPASLTSIPYYNAIDGLGSIADRLPVRCARTSTEVTCVCRVQEGIRLDAADWSGVVDDVVFATEASVARRLLTGDLARPALSGFEQMRASMAIHTDPIYMPSDRRDWVAVNAVRSGNFCEASIWYGGLRRSSWPVFKSWTTFRDRQPTEVIASEDYWHPVLTPDTVRAQRRLRSVQGRDGIWFAGSWTDDVDGQESAVVSAMRVAAGLGVTGHNLHHLQGARAGA